MGLAIAGIVTGGIGAVLALGYLVIWAFTSTLPSTY